MPQMHKLTARLASPLHARGKFGLFGAAEKEGPAFDRHRRRLPGKRNAKTAARGGEHRAARKIGQFRDAAAVGAHRGVFGARADFFSVGIRAHIQKIFAAEGAKMQADRRGVKERFAKAVADRGDLQFAERRGAFEQKDRVLSAEFVNAELGAPAKACREDLAADPVAAAELFKRERMHAPHVHPAAKYAAVQDGQPHGIDLFAAGDLADPLSPLFVEILRRRHRGKSADRASSRRLDRMPVEEQPLAAERPRKVGADESAFGTDIILSSADADF